MKKKKQDITKTPALGEDKHKENRANIRQLVKEFIAFDPREKEALKKIKKKLELACSDMIQAAIHNCIFSYFPSWERRDENKSVVLEIVNFFFDERWPHILRKLKSAKPDNSSSYIYVAARNSARSWLRDNHPELIVTAAILGRPADDDDDDDGDRRSKSRQRTESVQDGQKDPIELIWRKEKEEHFRYLGKKMSEALFSGKLSAKLRRTLLIHIFLLHSSRRVGNKKYLAEEAASRLSQSLCENVTESTFNLWFFRAKIKIKELLLEIEDEETMAYRKDKAEIYTVRGKKGSIDIAKDKKLAAAFNILYSEMR